MSGGGIHPGIAGDVSSSFAPASERTLSGVEYLLGALELGVVVLALVFTAVRLRRALLPGWTGAPAVVADAIGALTLALVLGELLGTFDLFTPAAYLVGSVALAGAGLWLSRRAEALRGQEGGEGERSVPPVPPAPEPMPAYAKWIVAVVVAAVFAGWAIPTLTAMAGGMGRADSLWYHMPAAVRFVQTGSMTQFDFFDPIFFAHFYPANSEVWHAIPILAFDRDFISPFVNLGFLALGLTAAWAIGRPYGLGAQSLLGAAVVLGAETMTDFQAGEALNDIVGVSLLLCAVALLVNAHAASGPAAGGARVSPAWAAVGFAGAAAGLAVGTKLSFVAPVALLAAAAVVAAPRGAHGRARAAWVFGLPLVLAGGYWYARNLANTGNPLPFTRWGPLDLPSPERAFELRPGFSVAHYWNDVDVWFGTSQYAGFTHYLAEELGPLWPVALIAVLAGGTYAIWRGREPLFRALGAVVVLTALAYVFTPLTAGGEEGDPIAFEWNIRYLVPAIAIGLALLPCLPALRATPARRVASLWVLGGLALLTTLTIVQWPEGGHTKGGIAAGLLVFGAMAAGIVARRAWPGMGAGLRLGALAGVALAVLAAGFAIQRHYLERRYENLSPQLNIAEAARWARDLQDARIAISGVRGVFNQYAFYGTDLSNHVQWLGLEGPDDAFLRIPDCETWRAAINDGGYTHVVTMYDPFDPATGELTDTKEALWTRTDRHAIEVLRDGPVSIFEIVAPLDPDACGTLPDLAPAELNGDSVNLEPSANQPPPGAEREAGGPDRAGGQGGQGDRGDAEGSTEASAS